VQFIDQAQIKIIGGKGGDGIVSFRREKFVPAGGPSGGDGGDGGSVIFEADSNLQTLLDFNFRKIVKANDGSRGGPNKMTGKCGINTVLKVPIGTEIRHFNTGIIFGDLIANKESIVIAFGGKGGHGNAHYLTNSNRAPEQFTLGREGEEWDIQLELKLLAEVGIIGLPNAGKSTLISVLSSAKPKIADYPFTTLIPNLGIVRKPSGDGTLFADIPGLIKGASQGSGLGHDFLRHIQRTKLLLHLIDVSSENPIEDWKLITTELEKYGKGLCSKPRLIVLTKSELIEEKKLEQLIGNLQELVNSKVLVISSSLRKGIDPLLSEVWERLEN
tara:strand:+ start:9090 stop:10079 length:990 start_codon:yes stop_codon:yes gene_type:complete